MMDWLLKLVTGLKPKESTEIFRILTPVMLIILLSGQHKIEENINKISTKIEVKFEENSKERARLLEANEKDKQEIRDRVANVRAMCCSESMFR